MSKFDRDRIVYTPLIDPDLFYAATRLATEKSLDEWLNQEGVLETSLVLANQTHSNQVLYTDSPGTYDNVDGFFTNKPDLYLTIRTADCAAVLITFPTVPAIGIAHSGWRGTKEDIVGVLLGDMLKEWDVDPATIRVAISPFLQPCCYEVGSEFSDYFAPKYLNRRNHKQYLKLDTLIIDQLGAFGIEPLQIDVSPECTACSKMPLYSYRKAKTDLRLLNVIAIRS